MRKNSNTEQRTHRQQTPTKIIVERHYVGTEKMETVFRRIVEEQITKKVKEIGMYQYANKTQKTGTNRTGFTEQLQKTGEATDTSKVDAYMEYLWSKYGNMRIQSVGKDQQSLGRVGKSMSGNDVVIAPSILEQMANDPEKAVYYEGKIDDFFNATPMLKASFAAQGLDYQPCGVVVHEDGSVTYISGCADSPERVAQVNAINKAKREKQAAARKAALEHSQEAAAWQRELMERYLTRKAFSVSMITDFDGTGGNLL